IAKLALCVIGDADGADAGGHPDPLVLLAKALHWHAHSPLLNPIGVAMRDERQLRDLPAELFAAHDQLDRRAEPGLGGLNQAHCHRAIDARTKPPRGDTANLRPGGPQNRGSLPRRRQALWADADPAAPRSLRQLLLNAPCARKPALRAAALGN